LGSRSLPSSRLVWARQRPSCSNAKGITQQIPWRTKMGRQRTKTRQARGCPPFARTGRCFDRRWHAQSKDSRPLYPKPSGHCRIVARSHEQYNPLVAMQHGHICRISVSSGNVFPGKVSVPPASVVSGVGDFMTPGAFIGPKSCCNVLRKIGVNLAEFDPLC